MRPMVGSIHDNDWKDIIDGVRFVQEATRELKANGVRIEIPTPMRWWEYGSAIQLVLNMRRKRGMDWIDVVDIGTGWGAVGPALLMSLPMVRVSEYEPDQMYWQDRAICNQYLMRQYQKCLNYYHFDLMDMPPQDYDAVFCISVMEHVPPSVEKKCWLELAKRVRPGGVLFVDVDLVPVAGRPYVCDEMRTHNFVIEEMQERVKMLEDVGLKTIGEPDWDYNGSYVHDSFTFFRVAMERPE